MRKKNYFHVIFAMIIMMNILVHYSYNLHALAYMIVSQGIEGKSHLMIIDQYNKFIHMFSISISTVPYVPTLQYRVRVYYLSLYHILFSLD